MSGEVIYSRYLPLDHVDIIGTISDDKSKYAQQHVDASYYTKFNVICDN